MEMRELYQPFNHTGESIKSALPTPCGEYNQGFMLPFQGNPNKPQNMELATQIDSRFLRTAAFV